MIASQHTHGHELIISSALRQDNMFNIERLPLDAGSILNFPDSSGLNYITDV